MSTRTVQALPSASLVIYNDQYIRIEYPMKQVSIAQAKARLSELVNRAVMGEEIVIARDNKPLVKLVNIVSDTTRARTPGSAKGEVWMAEDFDEPLEDFGPYR